MTEEECIKKGTSAGTGTCAIKNVSREETRLEWIARPGEVRAMEGAGQ